MLKSLQYLSWKSEPVCWLLATVYCIDFRFMLNTQIKLIQINIGISWFILMSILSFGTRLTDVNAMDWRLFVDYMYFE
jgi:hypothetical protein